MYRLFSNLLVFLSIFFLPVYITALMLIALIFTFDYFVEALLWAYIVDVLYGGGGSIFGFGFNYIFLFIMAVIFLVSFRVKKSLVFYRRA